MWAHIKLDGEKGYCTLEQFLDVPETKELWNDRSLVAGWTFHKDNIDGRKSTKRRLLSSPCSFQQMLPRRRQEAAAARLKMPNWQRAAAALDRRANAPGALALTCSSLHPTCLLLTLI